MNVSIPLKHVEHDAQSSSADGFHPKKKHMSPPHSADGVIRHNPPFTYIHNTPTTKKPNGKYAADSVGKDERLYEEIDPHVKKRVEVSHLDKRTQNRHVGKQSITLNTVEDESSDDYDDALTLQPAISPGVKPAAYFYGGDHASKNGHPGRGLAVHGDGGIYEELGNLPNPPPIPVVRTPVTDDVYQDNQVGDDDAIYQVDAVADEDDIYQDGAVAEEDDIYNDDAVANTALPIRRWDRFQSAEDEAIARSSLFQQEKTDEVSTSIANIMASPNNTRPQQFFFHTAATHRKGRKPWM